MEIKSKVSRVRRKINVDEKAGTKEKILDGAQKLFLEHGYTKTTMRMIAQEADVNLGLIPYYFEKKENMGTEIYSRYMSKFHKRIHHKEYRVKNSIEHLLVTYLMLQYYMNLEPGLLKLYVELVKEDVLKYSIEGYSFRSLELIEKEYGLKLESIDLATTINIIKGVERAFIIASVDGKLDMNFFDININMVKCALLYMGISQDTLDKNVKAVKEKLEEKGIDFRVFDAVIE